MHELLNRHPLFITLSNDDISNLAKHYHFIEKEYKKNEYILIEGDSVEYIGIIIKGSILMEKNDIYGNKNFFTKLREHELFGEPFMDHKIRNSFVSYKAMTNCTIYTFYYSDIWHRPYPVHQIQSVFIENLLSLMAFKTRSTLIKLDILSKKTIRQKIMTLFTTLKNNPDLIGFSLPLKAKLELNHYNSNSLIYIPLNRTQLSEYLCVNRSSMVRELTKMKSEGLIDYDGYVFFVNIND